MMRSEKPFWYNSLYTSETQTVAVLAHFLSWIKIPQIYLSFQKVKSMSIGADLWKTVCIHCAATVYGLKKKLDKKHVLFSLTGIQTKRNHIAVPDKSVRLK